MNEEDVAPRTVAPCVPVDGRRLRSERSREQIVDALYALIEAGAMRPSAADVAAKAGVGLRTVFRHFEDMDSLFGEVAERIASKVMPKVVAPYESADWAGRLGELVSRRAEVYEQIFPFRLAANLRRFQSSFLMEGYRRFLVMERAGLKAVLPPEVSADETVFAALEVATGFDTWRRLRQDQSLTPVAAEQVMMMMARRLLGQ